MTSQRPSQLWNPVLKPVFTNPLLIHNAIQANSPPTNKSLLTTVLLGQPHREKRIISGESSGREVDYDPRIAIPRSPVKHFKKTIDI
ncbi:hypothetical protein AKJ42_02935 [candidate division MSBL1 archaeon SCGC-AAA261C02]|uniref:Uncharacterized protein n=2 Tax=candidate division MSBL1 TaxID=215777 RepID=A0A133UZI8_9EURY|nr:hypothetical protein AKJ42_02935 [candidate division MSBL1 archaeon SCGC-AAA261C02]KXB09573.1 hypothetical protein AKJ46_00040 [candidate division MSBL1 archaeon SCGC-AAA833K04]